MIRAALRRRFAAFAFACTAALVAGCSSLGMSHGETWVSQEAPMVSERVLWTVVESSMIKQGFPVLANEFDPKTNEARSGWRVELHPFKGHGYRERAVVGYALGSAGKLELRVRVEHEVNENLAKPLDLSLANWEGAPDNADKAEILMQTIQSTLRSGD